MKKKPCSCCESTVVGVLVFTVPTGSVPSFKERQLATDIFSAAIAFVESEEWDVTGKFTIPEGQNGSVQNP